MILGRELAKIIKVKVGENITLMATTVDGTINTIDLEVSGIFETGIEDKSLIDFIHNTEKGTVILNIQNNLYIKVPTSKRAIKIPHTKTSRGGFNWRYTRT